MAFSHILDPLRERQEAEQDAQELIPVGEAGPADYA